MHFRHSSPLNRREDSSCPGNQVSGKGKILMNIPEFQNDAESVVFFTVHNGPSHALDSLNLSGQTHRSRTTFSVDGGWTQWTDWMPCSITCGRGHSVKHRQCEEPEPEHGGLNCSGQYMQVKDCESNPCTRESNLLTRSAVIASRRDVSV